MEASSSMTGYSVPGRLNGQVQRYHHFAKCQVCPWKVNDPSQAEIERHSKEHPTTQYLHDIRLCKQGRCDA